MLMAVLTMFKEEGQRHYSLPAPAPAHHLPSVLPGMHMPRLGNDTASASDYCDISTYTILCLLELLQLINQCHKNTCVTSVTIGSMINIFMVTKGMQNSKKYAPFERQYFIYMAC